MNNDITMRWLDRLIRGSFYALIFFLPISIALVGTFAAFAIFFFLVKRIVRVTKNKTVGFKAVIDVVRPNPPFLMWPLLSFIGAVVVSVVFSQYHHLSITAFFGKILRGVYLLSSFLEAFTEVAAICNFVMVWFVSAFVAGVSGLNQHLTHVDFLRHVETADGRISSSLRQANDFGAYLILIAPLLLMLSFYWKSIEKQFHKGFHGKILKGPVLYFFILMVTLIVVSCLGLTFSRGSWVAFFLSMVIIGLYQKKSLPGIITVIVVFYLIFAPWMVHIRDTSLFEDNVHNKSKMTRAEIAVEAQHPISRVIDNIGSGRWMYWKEALNIIEDYPVFGAGLNTYSQMGQKYRIDWGGYPHNSFLQMAAEIGIVGVGSFIWILFAFFEQAFIALNRRPEGLLSVMLLGLVAGLGAFVLQSGVDTTLYSVQLSVLFWLILSLGVAITQRLEYAPKA